MDHRLKLGLVDVFSVVCENARAPSAKTLGMDASRGEWRTPLWVLL